MPYGNYAPFYRNGYFNPMQAVQPQMPMIPDGQQQYAPVYQQAAQPIQQIPQAQAPTDMLWVLNENEAASYPVAPNNAVTLWDKNEPTIYIKSVNAQGVPSLRILDFTERTSNASKTPVEHNCQCGDKFVTREQFEALQGKFEEMAAIVDGIKASAAKKTKKDGDD